MAEKQEKEEQKDKKIESYGQVLLGEDEHNGKIQLMTIIGEIEGHDVLPAASKTTKYEHILPQLASIEDMPRVARRSICCPSPRTRIPFCPIGRR